MECICLLLNEWLIYVHELLAQHEVSMAGYWRNFFFHIHRYMEESVLLGTKACSKRRATAVPNSNEIVISI